MSDNKLITVDSITNSVSSFIKEHPDEVIEIARQGISQLVNGIIGICNSFSDKYNENAMRQYEIDATKYIAALESATKIEMQKLKTREEIIKRHADQVDKLVDAIANSTNPITASIQTVALVKLTGDLKIQLGEKKSVFSKIVNKFHKDKNDNDDIIKMLHKYV